MRPRPANEAELHDHFRLRALQLIAGRDEAAYLPIPGASPAQTPTPGAGWSGEADRGQQNAGRMRTLASRPSDTTAAPSFIEHHDCPRCAQQARQIGYTLA